MTPLVPTRLETARLRLRPFAADDWRDLHYYFGDPAATRYTFGRQLTEGDTWRIVAGIIGHWQLRGLGPYALEQKSAARVIGVCGFWYPGDWPELEIKWGLAARHHGRGYAAEAARAVLAAGRRALQGFRPISLVHPDNVASANLARALGAVHESDFDFEGEPHHVYRHAAADGAPRQPAG